MNYLSTQTDSPLSEAQRPDKTEAEKIDADLHYLRTQPQRGARRLSETVQMEAQLRDCMRGL